MSRVQFDLRTSRRPGVAICTLWPAFASDRFEKQTFVLPYGGNDRIRPKELEPGDYWVQAKMPDGELVKQFVSVSGEQAHFRVVLKSLDATTPEHSKDLVAGRATDIADRVFQTGLSGLARGGVDGLTGGGVGGLIGGGLTAVFNWLEKKKYLPDPAGGDELVHAARTSSLRVTRLHGRFDRILKALLNPASLGSEPKEYLERFIRSAARNAMRDSDSTRLAYELLDNVPQSVLYFDRGHPRPRSHGRAFVFIRQPFQRTRLLISVPDDSRGEIARIRIRPENEKSGSPLHASVEVEDPKFDSLLQFMNGGDISAAIDLIEDSVELLYAKFENPFAAAAAGYALIHAAPGTLRVPWQEWIGNLGLYFDNVPDGDVLHATLLLQRGDASEWSTHDVEDSARYFPRSEKERLLLAAELTLRSLAKGPPLFRPGLQLLASNLRILLSSTGAVRKPLKEALIEAEKLVTWLSMRVDPNESFAVFRLG